MDKAVVAVLFGGRSSEHAISSATAGGVLRAIDRDRFDVIPVGITRDGAFVLEDDDPDKFALNPERLPEVVDNGTRILWPDSVRSRELRVQDADGIRTLTVLRPAQVTSLTSGPRGMTIVSGPGQKAAASFLARSGTSETMPFSISMPQICTMSGLSCGRPFASKIFLTASPLRASAAMP